MDKILDTYKSIVVGTRKLKFANFTLLIITIAVLIISAITVYLFHLESIQNREILEYDGHVRSFTSISPQEADIIKGLAFVEDFCDHFLAFDPSNVQGNLEYAIELGDNSIKECYKAFMSKNWYNDVIANNLRQKYHFTETPKVVASGGFYTVQVNAILTLQDMAGSSEILEYSFYFTCYLVPVKAEFPKFKQGLFINDFDYILNPLF
jgi:hypothetical protein